MGYFAITSPDSDLVINKTSESIFVAKKHVFTFFELEISNRNNILSNYLSLDNLKKYIVVEIIFHGKVLKCENAKNIVSDSGFISWYYSQKNIENAGSNRFIYMNKSLTVIIDSEVEAVYDKINNITTVTVKVPINQAVIRPVFVDGEDEDIQTIQTIQTIHTFFTFYSSGQTVRQKGNIFAESRYFDKKLLPEADFVQQHIIQGVFLEVKRIYCWFIMPKGYIANDYTSFGKFFPRDIRIIEKGYNVLLNNHSFLKRKINRLSDYIRGCPQVINWKIEEENISYYKNYKDIGKWDEIRLFVSCAGFPLGTLFIFCSGVSSIIALLMALMFGWFP